MSDGIIGRRPFTDRVERDVYQGDDGRQYVLDDWGIQVYGVWMLPDSSEDAPGVANGRQRKDAPLGHHYGDGQGATAEARDTEVQAVAR